MGKLLRYFTENATRLRKNLKLSQAGLADLTGIKSTQLNRYLKGKAEPRFAALEAIAKALRAEPWELLQDPRLASEEVMNFSASFLKLVDGGADPEVAARELLKLFRGDAQKPSA